MPTGNPLIAQGTLNKVRASVSFTSLPQLNVSASFLGDDMIRIALEGDAVTYINTAAGAVTSPEPYIPASVRIALLRTQALAASFKAQMENTALIGDYTVRTDAPNFPPYSFTNGGIRRIEDIEINGKNAGWVILLGGYYLVNQSLWG